MSKPSVPKTQPGNVSKPAFCASCTEVTSNLVPRGIGRGDGIVWLCKTCDEEHPRQGRYSYDGGEQPERGMGFHSGNRQASPRGAGPGRGRG